MPTISLCMIVRDEEATLARCLQSVAGVADEIVIVDTGSRDATKAIAGTFTDTVLDFDWVDDFAAARNYSFANATSDYLLWLDADDVLLPQDRQALLELKSQLTAEVDAVSMAYHITFDESGAVAQSTRRIRLVRKAKGFVWEGVVHEDLVCGQQFRQLGTDIVVTHLKPANAAGLSERNLRIYQRHLAEGRAMRPADFFHHGRELKAHKRFAEAIPQFEHFLDSGEVDVDVALFALHELASCYYAVGRPEKEWECTLRSLAYDVPRPEFACRLGEHFLKKDQYAQAIYWYNVALDNPRGAGGAVETHALQTWLPHKQLALCYYQIGDYPRSLHHNRQAYGYLPNDAGIRANIELLEGLVSGIAPG